MDVNYPIYFTKKGRGWRKSSISVTLKYEDGTRCETSSLDQSHLEGNSFTIYGGPVSGYYIDPDTDEKIRITNLVGARNGELLKECPHCGKIKRQDEFDYSGRFTGEQRDQSDCADCRSIY